MTTINFKPFIPVSKYTQLTDLNLCAGDWLVLRTEAVKVQGQVPYGNQLSAEPTSTRTRKGCVTKKYSDYVVIDEDIILLSPEHCEGKQFPEIDQFVYVEFIESTQLKHTEFKLRAIFLRVCSNQLKQRRYKEDGYTKYSNQVGIWVWCGMGYGNNFTFFAYTGG